MARQITTECPVCKLPAIEKSSLKLDTDTTMITYICGHTQIRKINHADYNITSKDGKTLRPFQRDGIRFIEDTDFRCLVADEMGLGKTVQYLSSLKLHPEKLPVMFFVKSGLKIQLMLEIHRWIDTMMIQVIESSNTKVFPFPYTVVSYETFARIKDADKKFAFVKTLVIDECQHIKNEDAARTNAVRVFVNRLKIKNIILASGTPVKNRAEEFFVALNMIAPEKFPTKEIYIKRYMNYYTEWNGNLKVTGAKPEFSEALDGLMIRRLREEVEPDLPTINRIFMNSEITDKGLSKSYKQVQKEFEEFYNDAVQEGKDHGAAFYTSLLGFFARMRSITGFAKIESCTEYVTDFLLSTDRKIVIFGHHKETLAALADVLDTWVTDGGYAKCLRLSADMNAEARHHAVTEFEKNPRCRILIASTLASGEGLNLQFCSDAIMLERQWNPANEEQAEARFTRIGATSNKVNITYMIAVGTIDEWLTELVEEKRALIQNVIDGKEVNYIESELMSALARKVMEKGGAKWTY